jgi:hypothetical protein
MEQSRVSHTEPFCKIIAVVGEPLRRWPGRYENKTPNVLAVGHLPVFASPFVGPIP